MTRATNDSDAASSGRYDRRRLVGIAAVWIVAAVALFVAQPQFGAIAENSYCVDNSNNDWCDYPAPPEEDEGGIVLGTSYMTGGNLYFDETFTREYPEGGTEDVAKVGLDDINPQTFFVYKTWGYYDSRTGSNEDVYVWIDTGEARLSGPGSCGDDGDGSECDLLTYLTELSSPVFSGEVLGITFNLFDYWVLKPEQDTCGIPTICLELASDFSADTEVNNAMFRVHRIEAGGPGTTYNKELRLNDVYAEMRYGNGHDRVHVVDGRSESQCPGSGWCSPAWSNPAPDDAHGLTNTFDCEGSDGGGIFLSGDQSHLDCSDND